MRITRETLLRIARETAAQRTHDDRALIAAYLTGSLLSEEPFLGGATDIDLVFVHTSEPVTKREIVPLTPEVHLDIAFHARNDYEPARELRTHPWLGAEMYDPILLGQSEHFFEFVQAIVRDKFHEPANILQRARKYLKFARQVWTAIQLRPDISPGGLLEYIKSVGLAANAIAVLNGPPLAERRFLLQFPARAEAAGEPGLTTGLLGLLGAPNVDATALTGFLPSWQDAFSEAGNQTKVDAHLNPARLEYYRLAFEAILTGENPHALLMPLMHTWSMAVAYLPLDSPQRHAWRNACQQLDLMGTGLQSRLEGLDHYLDRIEELLDNLAASNGL